MGDIETQSFAWDRFSAEIGPSRIVLRYKHLFGRKLSITLADLRKRKSWQAPATYQYLEPVLTRQYAIIKIVAAPGVSITLRGFPPLPYEPNPLVPLLEIIRVQDPELVPSIGYDFNSHHLLGEYDENPSALGVPSAAESPYDFSHWLTTAPAFVSVVPLHNGVLLRHHWSRQDLVITVPTCIGDPEFTLREPESFDDEAKFFFQVNAGGMLNGRRTSKSTRLPIVEVVKTPAVKVEIAQQPREYSLTRWGESLSRDELFYEIHETDKLTDVPHPGEPFAEIRPAWRRVRSIDVAQPIVVSPGLAAVDAAIRFVPYLGTAVDLAEFTNALFTGRDLFGRKLSTTDIAILGIGTLLPLAAGGAANAHSVLGARVFGRKAATARPLLLRMRRALTRDDARLIDDVVADIKKGRLLSLVEVKRCKEIVAKLRGEPPTVDQLLNVDQTGFTHAELQAAYRDYRKRTTNPAGPREWALGRTRNPHAMTLLKGFLGADYIKRAKARQPARTVNLFEAPRPTDLSDEAAAKHLSAVFSQPSRRLRRLERLLGRAVRGLDPDGVLRQLPMSTATVPLWLFNQIKGLITEILSYQIKLRHLAELSATYPSARLYSGVRIRLMGTDGVLGPPLEFTDDIIAFRKGNSLQLLRVYEVKSGFRGGQEGTVQSFEWIERRLTDAEGSVLILPRGGELTLPDGTVQVRKTEAVFVYDPGAPPTRHVVGLNSAKRYLITPKGKSHLGINSADQIATGVQRTDVGLTAEQVEQLTRLNIRTSVKPAEDVYVWMAPTVEHLDGITSAQMDWLVAQVVGKVAARTVVEPADED